MLHARPTCLRCRRPESVCYCRFLTSIETRTRILLLQHPRERNVPIGTARLASLCLPAAELHVGIDWDNHPGIQQALADPARPAVLLYPGESALDVTASPPSGPVTLVVIDGTWPQTRKVVRLNPRLAALPRFTFSPPNPSEYRIRREPRAHCVSTLEALVHVLGALEADPDRFRPLLTPFRAMIDTQIDCEARLHTPWSRKKTPARLARSLIPPLPPALLAHTGDLVCLTVEANAWPTRSSGAHPDELVYLLAERLGTGERLEAMIAPRGPLNPATLTHTGLQLEPLLAGLDWQTFTDRWRAFIRETDLLCAWGGFAFTLLEREGCTPPVARIDLRRAVGDLLRERPGLMEQALERLGLRASEPWGEGRAGQRLAQLKAVAGYGREQAALAARGAAGPLE